MAKKNRSKPSKPRNDEYLFAIVAVVGSLVIGAGFCLLLFALNHHENNPPGESIAALENPPSNLIPPDHPRQLVDFTLTNSDDRVVTHSNLAGRILVVDFLLTSCAVTCPAVNAEMAQIQQLTTNRPDIKLVSLTVDPDDDTPDVLAQYSQRFGADTNRWMFLTGDKSQLYHLIGTSFLPPDTDSAYSYMPGNFAHTERIALIDSHGDLRGSFDGLNQNTPAAVINEITNLLNQSL
jgi:protein SCO1/2